MFGFVVKPMCALFQLETRKAETDALCVSIRGRIEELWRMLEIPDEQRESLIHQTHTSTKSSLNTVSVHTHGTCHECRSSCSFEILWCNRACFSLFTAAGRAAMFGGHEKEKHRACYSLDQIGDRKVLGEMLLQPGAETSLYFLQ